MFQKYSNVDSFIKHKQIFTEMAKAMPDKDSPAGKALEVSEFTNTLRQSEVQKLTTNSYTLVKLQANETETPYSRLVAMFNTWWSSKTETSKLTQPATNIFLSFPYYSFVAIYR